MQLHELTIQQAHEKLLKKDCSVEDLTRAFLERIEHRDQEIHAYLALMSEDALNAAQNLDKKVAQGHALGLLGGIPCAIKDNILIEGHPCTAGSKILEHYRASYDAYVIKKLKEEEVIFLGKTNLDEFAMGASTENSAYFVTRNPYDLTKVPGGSSGGSAAAVAADLCVFALGSDTGGSVRQPAALCGVVGLKPTYGAISRSGLIAMASSLDQIGVLGKTVEDCRIVFHAIEGKDPLDSTSIGEEQREAPKKFDIDKLRIGLPKEYFQEGLDPEIKKNIMDGAVFFERSGAHIQEISLPHSPYALATYYLLMPCEVSANLARYDGIRYGASTGDGDLLDVYLATRRELFGPEVRRRIMLGTFALSAGYYEAYYLQAQKVRTLIRRDFEAAFEEVDCIIGPTSPTVAFSIGEKIKDPVQMYLADIYTVAINLAGLPAVSIPSSRAHHLPCGLQIIGKPFGEDFILDTAAFFEHQYTPSL